MAISVQCPGCKKALKTQDEAAGRRLKCPACGTAVLVPAVAPQPLAAPEPTAPTPVAPLPRRAGLEGLSPDYRIRLGRWIEVAWPHFGAVLGPSIGYLFVFAVVFAISFYLLLLPFLILIEESGTVKLLALPVALVALVPWLIVIPPMAIGFHVVCQAQLKGKPWTFGMFFSGFRWTWPLALRAVLLTPLDLAAWLPSLIFPAICRLIWREPPGIVAGAASVLSMTCSLAAAYLMLRLAFFSHLLIIDRGCNAVEALKGSWRLSRGHFWGLFGVALLLVGGASLVGILTLGLGFLLAVPAMVLLLNAGYLLIAGAEPLPGLEYDSQRAAPRRRWLLAWAPLVPIGAAVVLIGVFTGWTANAVRTRLDWELARKQQESARYAELARMREAEFREEMERQGRELVNFFREGGWWSMEIHSRGPEAAPAETTAREGAAPPTGVPGPGGLGGGTAEARRLQVLVLGPLELLKAKPAVRLGTPAAPGPGWAETMHRLEQLPFADWERRRTFFHHFADALVKGEVEAVLVEFTPPASSTGPGSAGGLGGPDSAGGLGATPSVTGGDAGGAAITRPPAIPVPLDKAVPVNRERFWELVEGGGSRP